MCLLPSQRCITLYLFFLLQPRPPFLPRLCRNTSGLSREGTSSSRLSPAAAAAAAGGKEVVHRRAPGTRASGGGARPRPVSVAVSGMTQSMYEKRPTSSSAVSTPTNPRQHSVKSETTTYTCGFLLWFCSFCAHCTSFSQDFNLYMK